jgi:hypothetical protein
MVNMLSRKLLHSMLGLLYLEFVLGIMAALYQEIPEGQASVEVYRQLGYVSLHAALALALVGLAVYIAIQAFRRKVARPELAMSTAGLGAILVSFGAGGAFVSTDNDALSLVMALGFLVAIAIYARLAYAQPHSSASRV